MKGAATIAKGRKNNRVKHDIGIGKKLDGEIFCGAVFSEVTC
jgi:hypothetical protein